jgi:toxin ParE1/3/4
MCCGQSGVLFDLSESTPLGSEQTDDPTVRVKVVLGYRYKIFYRIREYGIEIVHVRHTSRRPWIGP